MPELASAKSKLADNSTIRSNSLSSRLSSPWMIFLPGLVVRLIYITVAHSYRFHPSCDHFEFGWEAGRVGRSLGLGARLLPIHLCLPGRGRRRGCLRCIR